MPQREAFPQLIVPPRIPPRRNESLPDYAARMAETITPSRDRPLVLGGVSFGGMLAYEMARHLRPDVVVLIASCRKQESLSPVYRAGRRLVPWIPFWVWSVAKLDLISGVVVRMRLGVAASQRDLAIRMFRDADSRYMHWTLQAILNWDPQPLLGVRVLQIHGGRDSLIPARRVEADQIIPDGGHMINVTHADQVNLFITKAAAMSQEIQTFYEDATAYCALIDSLANGKPERFYEQLLTCLTRLAKSADELPHGRCPGDIECGGHEMTQDERAEVARRLSDAVSPEVFGLMEADKDDSASSHRAFMLWDDLADIYRDLHDGVRFYDSGEKDGMEEAVWQWKFGYEHHWGSHLFNALHTVHGIRHELYEE